jgi:hypothetical protein
MSYPKSESLRATLAATLWLTASTCRDRNSYGHYDPEHLGSEEQ